MKQNPGINGAEERVVDSIEYIFDKRYRGTHIIFLLDALLEGVQSSIHIAITWTTGYKVYEL